MRHSILIIPCFWVGAAFGVAASSSPAVAEPFDAIPARASVQTLLRGTLDADLTPGGTDLNGDVKRIEAAVFVGDWTAQGRFRLESPQNSGPRVLHDTATGAATIGYDDGAWLRWYASAGAQNGRLLGVEQDFVAKAHRTAGFKGARRSDASTAGRAFVSADVVAQKSYALFSSRSFELGASPIAWLSAGTNQMQVGAGMFLVMGLASPASDVQINPATLAQTRIRGSFLYAGAAARHVFRDDLYKGVETRAAMLSAILGAKAEMGGYVAGAEMNRPLTPEARGAKRPAIGTYAVSIGKTF